MQQKLYTKTINNIKYIEPRNNIILSILNRKIYNPSEELLFKHGWVEYIENDDVIIDELQAAKHEIKSQIIEHDTSIHVNIFYINGEPLWFDKTMRNNLMQRFNAEKHEGLENTKIWYNDIEYELSIDIAINILYKLEVYAAKCFDTTQTHLNNIEEMDDVECVKNYDFYAGYPVPIQFNI